jgi:hypothetical protein
MKRYPFCFAIGWILLFSALAGCGWTKQGSVEQWISSAPQHSVMDFTGRWQVNTSSSEWVVSWAPMFLNQSQARVTGIYGEYELMGVVNNNEIIFFGLQKGLVYLTWHLTYHPKLKALMGKQCDGYRPMDKGCGSNVVFYKSF